jgi:hypothetical protein
MYYLVDLIFRICRGERLEKTTSRGWRVYGAILLFFPILIALLFYDSGKSPIQKLLDQNSMANILLPLLGSVTWILCLIIWIKYVPTIISWIFIPIVWTIVLRLAFAGIIHS